ncbi:MAG: hypothetical protein [Bacteriophage sp.]|nr:MAG: hypothetical protein [Bacteriophage sp.]QIG78066.1 hypothetical protein BRUR0010001c01_00035 [Bifidobacterium phage BlindUri1]QIG78107.1 hypothetical protein BLBA0010001c01_00030 [Bifidobacterium phage BlindBasel1]
MVNDTSSQKPQRDAQGRLLPGNTANPQGKGGFAEHPENRSDGRWSGRASVTFNLNRFKAMTKPELDKVAADSDNLTQAEYLALQAVLRARKETEFGFKNYQDLVDRTEGKPRQTIDANVSQVEPPHITVNFK